MGIVVVGRGGFRCGRSRQTNQEKINEFDHKVKELGVIKLVFVVLYFPFCFMDNVFVAKSCQESRISSVVRTYSRSWIGYVDTP